MDITRTAHSNWRGSLVQGSGTVAFASSGIGEFAVSWPARPESSKGLTTPAELIAAAHSSCFSMTLSHVLTKAGNPPHHLATQAEVIIDDVAPDALITIRLTVEGEVPELDEEAFAKAAEDAKASCPVSQALSGVIILLTATLR